MGVSARDEILDWRATYHNQDHGRSAGEIMKATQFEFRHRFWVIGFVFWVGFGLYAVDPLNVVQWVAERAAPGNNAKQMLIVHGLFCVGALLIFMAASLRTWAAAYLRSNVVQDPSLHAEKIVADGPYRHLRNPLYLGSILLALGMGLLASRVGFLVIVVGSAIVFLRLAGLEESTLDREHGEPYREFCKKVPRLWPALAPRLPAGGTEPRWRQAFLGEMFMWGFFLAVAAFAVTLNTKVTWTIVALALLVYIVRSYVLFYSRKKRTAIETPANPTP
ncbi:MAG: isoprenylcysteine carboxylmethyltransferase family protein [Candidatus Acidiferrales bacterium]